MTTVAEPITGAATELALRLILRDIVRGGVAGVIAGVTVAGIGGRLVMRFAALVVPSATGSATENGNTIGVITLPGTAGLVLLGAFFGLFIGTIWVALAPWIPWTGVRRAVATMPLAVALGAIGLIHGPNPDFVVLDHSPVVVAALVLLVAAVGLVVALADGWLDRILPGVENASGRVIATYFGLASLGGLFAVTAVLGAYFGGDRPHVALGLALLVAGGATLAWWGLRLRGVTDPPRTVTLVGRIGLAAILVIGTIDLVPEVSQALRR